MIRMVKTAALVIVLMSASKAWAIEAYSEDLTGSFMSWCQDTKSQTPSVCSCMLGKLAMEVPASALTSFLAGGSMSMTSAGTSVAGAVGQSVTMCSLGGGSSTPGLPSF